jgi:hypothetical protein
VIAKLKRDLTIALAIALGITAGGFLLSRHDSERVSATASTPAVVRANDAALRADAEEKTQADLAQWYSTAEFTTAANFAQALLDDAAHDRAEQARRAQVRSASSSRPSSGAAASSGNCANPVVPESIAMRESRCTYDAYNRTGCGGRGCIGFYQIDAGHYAADSPWGPGHGSCYGLGDPWDPAVQTECAKRLGPHAWDL